MSRNSVTFIVVPFRKLSSAAKSNKNRHTMKVITKRDARWQAALERAARQQVRGWGGYVGGEWCVGGVCKVCAMWVVCELGVGGVCVVCELSVVCAVWVVFVLCVVCGVWVVCE